jgi:hypothetical protein
MKNKNELKNVLSIVYTIYMSQDSLRGGENTVVESFETLKTS